MKTTWMIIAASAAVAVGLQVALAKDPPAGVSKPQVKYAEVQKVLDANCIKCHGDARPRGGINLTKYESVMKGGEDGPIVVAGDLKKSILYLAITQAQGYRPMPPKGKMSAKDIGIIESWIKAGAKK